MAHSSFFSDWEIREMAELKKEIEESGVRYEKLWRDLRDLEDSRTC